MRIIRFLANDHLEHFGEDHRDSTATILHGSIANSLTRTTRRVAVQRVLTPLVPTDIICIGRSYKPRIAPPMGEDGDRAQSHQDDATLEVFLKPSTALQSPHGQIRMPQFSGLDVQLDCEGELAIIIGRDANQVSESDALNHIFGYTIANDITARAFQTATGPPLWMRGKGFDTFCPIGPAIVTADEIPDPQSLAIRTMINGEIVREGNTGDMIRTVPQIIAALSRHMTLRTGSIILTGAPPTLRSANRPLRTGDRIAIEVEKIGVLENVIG